MGLLSSYPTTTTLDSTDVFPFADTDNKVKTITAPALVAALYELDPPPAGSTGSGPIVGVSPSFSLPALSAFTLQNPFSSGTTLTKPITNGPVLLTAALSSGDSMQFATIPAPGTTPWTKTMLLEWDNLGPYDDSSAYMILYNSATGGLIWFGIVGGEIYVQYWTNVSASGTATINNFAYNHFGTVWLKVTNDGTNLTFSVSKNNVAYTVVATTTLASHIGAVTDVGFGVDNNHQAAASLVYLWSFA